MADKWSLTGTYFEACNRTVRPLASVSFSVRLM